MSNIDLVQAILSRAREREGYVTKTKLVKYLYLFDVEHFRRTGRTFTGFSWLFHLYGPWAREFEDLYSRMRSDDPTLILLARRQHLGTVFLAPSRTFEHTDVVDDTTLESRYHHL